MLSTFSANELFISQLNGSNFTAWYAEVLIARISQEIELHTHKQIIMLKLILSDCIGSTVTHLSLIRTSVLTKSFQIQLGLFK